MKNNIFLLTENLNHKVYSLLDLLKYRGFLPSTSLLINTDKKHKTVVEEVPSTLFKRDFYYLKSFVDENLICVENKNEMFEFILENPHNIFVFDGKYPNFTMNIENESGGDIKREQIWETDLGWFPWSSSGYYTQGSAGPWSILADSEMDYIPDINKDRFDHFQKEFKDNLYDIESRHGNNRPLEEENFVLVTLQNDEREAKLDFSPFEDQQEFFEFVIDIFPGEETFYIKQHPNHTESWFDIPEEDNVKDITTLGYNKHELFQNCKAVVTQNSTTALEGLVYMKKVFTYAKEVYSNKNVTFEDIRETSKIRSILSCPISCNRKNRIKKFISFLERSQINRSKVFEEPSAADYYRSRLFVDAIENKLDSL